MYFKREAFRNIFQNIPYRVVALLNVRCPGPMTTYYLVGVVATVSVILITAIQLPHFRGDAGDRFFVQPTLNRSIWGLVICGVNFVLLVWVYYKRPDNAKPPEIQLQEVASILPSAPPLYLIEEDV